MYILIFISVMAPTQKPELRDTAIAAYLKGNPYRYASLFT